MVKLLLNVNELQANLEAPLIALIKAKNPKLKIDSIEYVNLENEFNLEQKRTGVIVDEDIAIRRILAYVFLSPSSENAGNTFVAQTIFPDLIDLMEVCINSPSFTILNHPIYFINMVDGLITRPSTKRDFAFLSSIDIHYLELFNYQIINIDDIPKYLPDFHNEYVVGLKLTGKYYSFSVPERTLSILFPIDKLLNADQNDFHGSYEKYFWTEVLSISLIAIKSGYKLNFEEFENFIITYESNFSSKSLKMKRCKTLLNYIKKLNHKKQFNEL